MSDCISTKFFTSRQKNHLKQRWQGKNENWLTGPTGMQICNFAFQFSCSRVPLRCLFEICLFVVDSDCRPGQRPPPAIAYSNAIKIAALDLHGCLFEIRLFISVCPAWTRGTESTRTPVPGLREKVSETQRLGARRLSQLGQPRFCFAPQASLLSTAYRA